ncbi:ASST-domain-containing protein [Aspergillus taichungensis]|uniref:ASST-domain-containing protein n=1 Tax=Aspergillus taichungensis TaxID=482145 RepID=A0A2J5HJM3_9EURO|nr:ASST-domain-containing protein [Aspergillus taichungensis]
MAHILLYWAFLPLLASALSWHSWWYEMGVFGAHPTVKHVSFDQEAPEVNVLQWDPRCEDGYVLLSPRGRFYPEPGPLIYDNRGNLVWIDNQFGMVMDLNVQHYKGQNYLTFFAGDDDGTRGIGSYYMLNSSYEVAHVVSAANGYSGDVHDFKITDQGTALMTIYEICPMDLSAVGGPEDGWVYDGLFQEIDIETGGLLFEWRARDHYAVEETYFERAEEKGTGPTAGKAFDYFHINSIAKDAHGNYLVSSRYMHTVTCISPSGDILWILGGKRNMFKDLSEDGSATEFTWQHDARWLSDNVITLLDNGAHEHLQTADYSRAYMIELDFENWTAKTLHVYESPGHFSSHSQGNVQVLPRTGNVFVGWGKPSAYTEFSADGEVLCDAHWGPSMFFWFGWIKSYRAQKAMWVGRPSTPPDVVMDGRSQTVYVSWNGATDVIGWVMQRASRRDASDKDFELVGYTAKEGFETSIAVPDEAEGHYLRMVAVDQEGETLGVTRVFETDQTPHAMSSGPSQENLQHTLLAACGLGVVLAAFWKGKRRILSLARCGRSVYDRV